MTFYITPGGIHVIHVCVTLNGLESYNKFNTFPGQCGSVGWRVTPKPKGFGFHSWSGRVPGYQVQSPSLGANGRQPIGASLSHRFLMFLSFPSSLSKSNEEKMFLGKDLIKRSWITNICYNSGNFWITSLNIFLSRCRKIMWEQSNLKARSILLKIWL